MRSISAAPRQCPNVTLRRASAQDRPYLRRLFAESCPQLAILPPDVQDVLIDMQFRARRAAFSSRDPGAEYHVLVAEDGNAGLLVLDPGDGVVWVIDVTVDASHRRRGIAAAALRQALDAAAPVPVRLSVGAENTVGRALYERLGFEPIGPSAAPGYLAMELRAG